MKSLKFLLLSATLMLSLNAFSQVSVGFKAGVNYSNIKGKVDGDIDDDTKMRLGFNVGPVLNYSFTDVLSVGTGFIFESKGYEYRIDNDGNYGNKAEYGKIVTNLIYLDIPISIKAKYDLGGVKIFGEFGPYVGFALAGKMKATKDLKEDMEDLGYDTEETFEFGNNEEDDNLRRMDFGLVFGAGIDIGKIEIGAGFDLGLANLIPGGDSDNFAKNRTFKLSVAYMIGK